MLEKAWGHLPDECKEGSVYFQPQPSLCFREASLGGPCLSLRECTRKGAQDSAPLLQLMALQQQLWFVPPLQPTLSLILPSLEESKAGASVRATLGF